VHRRLEAQSVAIKRDRCGHIVDEVAHSDSAASCHSRRDHDSGPGRRDTTQAPQREGFRDTLSAPIGTLPEGNRLGVGVVSGEPGQSAISSAVETTVANSSWMLAAVAR